MEGQRRQGGWGARGHADSDEAPPGRATAQHAQHSYQQSNRSMHSAACTAQRLHTHPPPHSPAPDLEPSACHTPTPWLRCLHRLHCRCCCRHLHQHCRPLLHCCCRCCCCRQRPPGGQTTNPGDPLPCCPPQALPPQQPCPRGAAQQRTGCGPAGSLHWWPALRGSAALRPPSRHRMHPSAGSKGCRFAGGRVATSRM